MDEETTVVADTAQSATPGEGSSQGAPDVSGLQQRINELTAFGREQERIAKEATSGLNEAMQRLARLEGKVESAQPAPGRRQEFDYSVFGDAAEPLKKALEAQQDQFQQQLAQMNANFAAQMRPTQVAAIGAGLGLPPTVIQRANDLAAAWAAKGLPLIAQDAVDFAVGEAMRAGTLKLPQAGQGGRAMGGSPAGATLHGGSPPLMPGVSNNGQPKGLVLPTNFEDLSPAQQEAWLSKNKVNTDFDL